MFKPFPRSSYRPASRRIGFTLIDWLAAVCLIATLIAQLLPPVNTVGNSAAQVRGQGDRSPDSEAAAWVQSIGGQVKTEDDRLVEINLLNNQKATEDGLKRLKGLHDLERLVLGGIPVTDKGIAHLQDLPSLLVLNLNATRISNDGLKQLKAMPSLAYLFLADTQITDEGLKHAAAISKLAVLHLGASQVTGSGLHYLKSQPNLVALQLGGPRIRLDELKNLKGLDNLREFVLLNVAMTDAALAHLHYLPKDIETLWISRTGLSEGAMQSFLKDYPQAKFK